MIGCIVCHKELENLDPPPHGNQPLRGSEFYTQGHYGSAVSDFMDGTELAVNICDLCLLDAKAHGRVLISKKPPPSPKRKYAIWS